LKGVKTGDLGPKFGYNSKDNGWATFDNVRIPRKNMMMGLAEVEKDGTFSVKGDLRVLYSTMMLIRTSIVCDSVNILYRSLQIALRYASVRRQFATINGSKVERKILDYQTLQHELTPVLAMATMQGATSLYFRNQFRLLMEEVKV
jgi:acyl-CoA oxidase